MRVFGCGDIIIAKKLAEKGYDGFEQIERIIKACDACFGNLETTVHDNEGYPSAFPGGGYTMASPSCLDSLKRFGFNVFNLANNHALDYSHKGLEATINHLKKADIPYFGAGINLTEAGAPAYVECKDGRVAFIGVTSSFHDSDAAGPAGGIVPGRPGVNPLRRKEYYQLTPELYESVELIADATGMNDGHKWSVANGYRDATESLFLRDMEFTKGNENCRITHPLMKDMARVKASILDAKYQADCIVVSFHSHQMEGEAKNPAAFIKEFCHECIDAGANIIFGHGAHELRGVEIYKGCPIFYGLGDFIFHNELQTAMPREFYEKVSIETEYYDNVGVAMNHRSRNETRGLQADPKAWEAVGAGIDFANGKVNSIDIYPVSLGQKLGHSRRGWPKLDDSGEVLSYFTKISKKDFDTDIDIINGVGRIQL